MTVMQELFLEIRYSGAAAATCMAISLAKASSVAAACDFHQRDNFTAEVRIDPNRFIGGFGENLQCVGFEYFRQLFAQLLHGIDQLSNDGSLEYFC